MKPTFYLCAMSLAVLWNFAAVAAVTCRTDGAGTTRCTDGSIYWSRLSEVPDGVSGNISDAAPAATASSSDTSTSRTGSVEKTHTKEEGKKNPEDGNINSDREE